MVIKKLKYVFVLLSGFFLIACSPEHIKETEIYSKGSKESLYHLKQWAFDGRLALKTKTDSWQANISWKHSIDEENIKLTGPLGQGATYIRLYGNRVSIERGDGKILISDHPEDFINQELGMFVPVKALRSWVTGIPDPSIHIIEMVNGFKQAEWMIEYDQMQDVGVYSMPRKVAVTNAKLKLKLVIDQWNINDAITK